MNIRINNNHGFTLLELIVVLMIMAIVSTIVISRLGSSTNSLIAQTEAIKSHIRYAQSRAMNGNLIWGINCNGSYYWLYKVNEDSSTAKVFLPGEGSEEDPDDDPYTVKLADIYISSMETFTLSFDSWGTPYTDAAASDGQELETGDSEAEITVSSGSKNISITITPNTGFIP